MTLQEVMTELEDYGNEQTKSVYLKHGAKEPFFGVKVQDLKKIVKKTKKNHELSLQLYETGNSDAMYLASLIADEKKITKEELRDWANKAYWYYLSEYAVAWTAADCPFGYELALEWIQSDKEHIASAGWATLSFWATVTPDEGIDIEKYSSLLDEVAGNIHESQNRVRFAKNGFVIATGSQIVSLTEKAKKVGSTIGKVSVDVGQIACKVPLATEYIQKVEYKGRLGKKKKKARC